jgi:DNA helicase-2/ATP-dependent DNA helicase PcrA
MLITDTFNLSDQQISIEDWVKFGKGNLIIEAVAGAGKTFTLVHILKYMTGYVYLGVYNSRMGVELKQKTEGMKNVKAGTLHSAGFGALRFRYKNTKVEPNKVRDMVRDFVNHQSPEMAPYEAFVIKAVGLAKDIGIGFFNNLFDIQPWYDMVDKFDLHDDIPEGLEVEEGIMMAQGILAASNKRLDIIDFGDMIYLTLMLKIKMLQNDWVLIDEAQDTNPTRRALAKKMLKPGGRLIAVGDPRQAIFGFTGADNDALDLIAKEFNTETLPLTNTFRCPKAVVRHAQQWVSHINAYDTNPEGEVINAKYDDVFGDKSTYTFSGDDAIICRLNAPIVELAFKLIRKGVPCRIEGRDIGTQLANLAGKWKSIKQLDELRDRLETYQTVEVQRALAQGKEQKADSVNDRVNCIFVLIDRAEEKNLDVAGLIEMIKGMFSDSTDRGVDKNMLTLSSVHKFKGLERPRIFLLGRLQHMPSPYARQAWQMDQEINLIYVAVTRAMETLVEVD